jgi:hypothetical protein
MGELQVSRSSPVWAEEKAETGPRRAEESRGGSQPMLIKRSSALESSSSIGVASTCSRVPSDRGSDLPGSLLSTSVCRPCRGV